MPEGDTVHKIANYLAPRLIGTRLVRGRARDVATRLDGRTVEAVYCHGKHLFMRLEQDLLLRSHLGLHGQWHRYDRSARWKKPMSQVSVELETAQDIYVLFNAREVELLKSSSVQARIWATRLGPDLVIAAPDEAQLLDRLQAFCERDEALVDVLLSQRVASGIGNVYKSELLFLCGLNPLLSWTRVSPDKLHSLYQLAHDLLTSNLGGGGRRTRFESDRHGSLWVHGRGGQPCIQCNTPVSTAKLGRSHRSAYWCAACQPGEN